MSASLASAGITKFEAHAPRHVREDWHDSVQNEHGRYILHEAAMLTAAKRIGHAFAASVPHPNKITTYLPFRYDVDVLLAYQRSLAEQAKGRLPASAVPDYENWLLTRLIDLDLPGLDNLRPEELIQIRAQSDEFEAWRRALADAIKFADSAVPERIMNRDAAVQREVTARLIDQRRKTGCACSLRRRASVAATGARSQSADLPLADRRLHHDVDAFEAENGCTRFVRSSHLRPFEPTETMPQPG